MKQILHILCGSEKALPVLFSQTGFSSFPEVLCSVQTDFLPLVLPADPQWKPEASVCFRISHSVEPDHILPSLPYCKLPLRELPIPSLHLHVQKQPSGLQFLLYDNGDCSHFYNLVHVLHQ